MSDARKPPAGMLKIGRDAWARALEGLTEPEMDAFADVAESYARQVDTRERLRRAWVKLGSPATAEGHAGRMIRHPLVAELRQADASIRALARELRLTPAAATPGKQGRPLGRASAPDRKPATETPERAAEAVAGEPPRIRLVARDGGA